MKQTDLGHLYSYYVHQHLGENRPATLDRYRKRINRELLLQRMTPSDIQGRVVFDIGSGYQALIFSEMGARQVFHVDISQRQVAHLQHLCKELNVTNIQSECVDVMSAVGSVQSWDLAFVYGVWHHLPAPQRLLFSLLERAAPSARLLLRVYRSGTWSRWLTAHLRTLATDHNPEQLSALFHQLFPLEGAKSFLADLLDDLLVPVWGAYHPNQFQQDANNLGLMFHCKDPMYDLDFGWRDENFRLSLEVSEGLRRHQTRDRLISSTPIDPLTLTTDSLIAEDFTSLWHSYKQHHLALPEHQRALRLITLYRLVREMPLIDYYRQSIATCRDPDDDLANLRVKQLCKILRCWMKGNSI